MVHDQHIWYGRMVRAIMLNDATLVAELAYENRSINTQDDTGRSILHIAIMHRRDRVLEPLIAAGADLSLVDERGLTPVALALEAGASTMRQLIDAARARGDDLTNHQFVEARLNPALQYVNLRVSPDPYTRVVATAVRTDVMRVIGVSEDWVELEVRPGVRGWSKLEWLDIGADA